MNFENLRIVMPSFSCNHRFLTAEPPARNDNPSVFVSAPTAAIQRFRSSFGIVARTDRSAIGASERCTQAGFPARDRAPKYSSGFHP
jgi:hypothetical protein